MFKNSLSQKWVKKCLLHLFWHSKLGCQMALIIQLNWIYKPVMVQKLDEVRQTGDTHFIKMF